MFKVDLASIKSDPLIVKEIEIVSPRITYEHSSGGSNLERLKQNIADFVKANKG